MNKIVLAGGCFWGLQKFFDQFEGIQTRVGYANGCGIPVSYQQVCAGSGHAEAVEILYPDSIQTIQLLAAFLAVIDPVSLNRQGNDVGISYRTGIYTTTPLQLDQARIMLQDLQQHYTKPIVVEAEPLKEFWSAEDYHQKYLDKNPGGYCHLPKGLLDGHRLPSIEEVLAAYPHLEPLYKEDSAH